MFDIDDLPLDWESLRGERVKRDDYECVECGEQRGLFVVLVSSNGPPSWKVDELKTVCMDHCEEWKQLDKMQVYPGKDYETVTRYSRLVFQAFSTS